MDKLLTFLAENNVDGLTEEIKVSNRIPYKFKIRALKDNEHKEFMRASQGNLKKDGVAFNSGKLQDLTLQACILYPDFQNAEFINKLGVHTPSEAMSKVLLPGEKQEIYERISKLSGFGADINEDIEEAKN